MPVAFERAVGSAQRASEVGEHCGSCLTMRSFSVFATLPECFHAEVESQMTLQVAMTSRDNMVVAVGSIVRVSDASRVQS
jgi:hypothetical protein